MTIKELVEQVKAADETAARANEAARLAAQALDERKDALLQAMQAEGIDSAKVEGFSATIRPKRRYGGSDWEQLYAYLKRSGDMQLLERRLSTKACDELLERRGGKGIPGVSLFEYQALQTRRG